LTPGALEYEAGVLTTQPRRSVSTLGFYLMLKHKYSVSIDLFRSWGSSVSIVFDYRLEDRATGIRSPQKQMIFSVVSVTRPALSPTQPLIQWIPGVISQEVKRRWDVTLTTHPI
jgi:hypothetical protein